MTWELGMADISGAGGGPGITWPSAQCPALTLLAYIVLTDYILVHIQPWSLWSFRFFELI